VALRRAVAECGLWSTHQHCGGVTYKLARVRLGIIADIHGNDVALRAVLKDADRFAVDRWWALGDLVLFGPRPVEVLQLLRSLPACCGGTPTATS
jgi:hypothetical protein